MSRSDCAIGAYSGFFSRSSISSMSILVGSTCPSSTNRSPGRCRCSRRSSRREGFEEGADLALHRFGVALVELDEQRHDAAGVQVPFRDDDRLAFWCAAPAGAQQVLVTSAPERFFVPPYVGQRGWLGVWLDVPVDWDEIADLVADAYRTVAPKRLAASLSEF